MASRGMGIMNPDKIPTTKRRKDGDQFSVYAEGGRVNEAGNYTKPEMRKRLFNQIKSQAVQGTNAGQWSARKAQLLAKKYKEAGGGYK